MGGYKERAQEPDGLAGALIAPAAKKDLVTVFIVSVAATSATRLIF